MGEQDWRQQLPQLHEQLLARTPQLVQLAELLHQLVGGEGGDDPATLEEQLEEHERWRQAVLGAIVLHVNAV